MQTLLLRTVSCVVDYAIVAVRVESTCLLHLYCSSMPAAAVGFPSHFNCRHMRVDAIQTTRALSLRAKVRACGGIGKATTRQTVLRGHLITCHPQLLSFSLSAFEASPFLTQVARYRSLYEAQASPASLVVCFPLPSQ